jgi:hypothetical protein
MQCDPQVVGHRYLLGVEGLAAVLPLTRVGLRLRSPTCQLVLQRGFAFHMFLLKLIPCCLVDITVWSECNAAGTWRVLAIFWVVKTAVLPLAYM